MEHFSNDHKVHPNQHENSHKLRDETVHPVLSLLQSQWKLRQQHDQNVPMERKLLQNKAVVEQILASEERKKSKRAGLLEPC